MQTVHSIHLKNAKKMTAIDDGSIDLIVTSPPYPMIEMWDNLFCRQNKKIAADLKSGRGMAAFEKMHTILDAVWDEVWRVTKNGAILCINIGDAVRTIKDRFALYANHSRIQTYMQKIGFSALPAILWRKQTNAPNKFMGSGMMPPGAYVTLEHEYILIFRKGNKKEFLTLKEKQNRRRSAFFWEERNQWFSDVWTDLKGTTQSLFDPKVRNRSAAFPFELAYRLISMFSVKGDTVLDPFLGLGTSVYAAMACARNSIGYEIEADFMNSILSQKEAVKALSNRRMEKRLQDHLEFIENRVQQQKPIKHHNAAYGFPVVTRQETELLLNALESVQQTGPISFEATYADTPQAAFVQEIEASAQTPTAVKKTRPALRKTAKPKQRLLF